MPDVVEVAEAQGEEEVREEAGEAEQKALATEQALRTEMQRMKSALGISVMLLRSGSLYFGEPSSFLLEP